MAEVISGGISTSSAVMASINPSLADLSDNAPIIEQFDTFLITQEG